MLVPECRSPGIVYSETIVHVGPPRLASEVPYQLAIIELPGGTRMTVRIVTSSKADLVQIGDRVEWVEEREGVSFYARSSESIHEVT